MITTVINSLVNHVYALMTMLTGWLTDLPAPYRDAIFAVLAIGALGCLLWLLTSAEQGGHRKPFLYHQPKAPRHAIDEGPTMAIERSLPRPVPLANDNVMVIEIHAPAAPALESVDLEGVHVGAYEGWHPADDVAAVDNDDAKWYAYLADARREYKRSGSEIEWAELQWGAGMADAMATADAWHAEHGAHCACCHVLIDTGEHVLIDRAWRIGSDTIEIPIVELAGAR